MDYNQNPSTLQPINPQTALSPRDPDEINLLEYAYVLVKNKWWIIGLTVFGLVLGYGAALIKGPTWVAEVLIAPHETESQKTPNLAGLGALGGLVASQLSFGGNASLDKIDLILDSREFGAKLIERYSLLPAIYKYQWPKDYQKSWDFSQNTWKADFIQPKPLDMGDFIKSKFLKKTTNKTNTMTLQIKSRDSTFSINLANNYIEYLNDYIKSNVQSDARENVSYLEKQLIAISDPLLREKIQGLIANEIEKEMVVSKEAFKVVDPVYLAKTFKEKRLYPLVFSFGLFFMTCLVLVFVQAFSSSDKTDEDRRLIEKIKKEMLLGGK
ncbi:MAG: Wzz/FepE/Etk N-terminal domain-containing protein [Chitinivibrionales bacterium]